MTDLLWDNTVTTLFRCDCKPPVHLPCAEVEVSWRDKCNTTAIIIGPPLILDEHIQEGVTLEILHDCPGLPRDVYDSSIVVMRLSNVRNITKHLPRVIAASSMDHAYIFLEATFTCELEILEGE